MANQIVSSTGIKETDQSVAVPTSRRLLSIDALRGLVMVFMALDHARYFILKAHSREFWGVDLPVYNSVIIFMTRLVSHLSAPGFFFLMGVGLMLFAESRRGKGWTERKIIRFFILRGVLLIIIEQVLEMPAWKLVYLVTPQLTTLGGTIGSGHAIVSVGVLYSLGASMIIWSFLLRTPIWVMALISAGAFAATNWYVPGPAGDPGFLTSWLQVALILPGKAGFLYTAYPIIPWLGMTGLGLTFARMLRANPSTAFPTAFYTGIGLLFLFVLLRLYDFGDFHHTGKGFIGFLNLTKYPPSLTFVCMTFGSNLILLCVFQSLKNVLDSPFLKPLLVFGRSALFFYIIHLYIYFIIGAIFPKGTSLELFYPLWLLGLAVLYPLCSWYNTFKQGTPVESVWRFF